MIGIQQVCMCAQQRIGPASAFMQCDQRLRRAPCRYSQRSNTSPGGQRRLIDDTRLSRTVRNESSQEGEGVGVGTYIL